ncbi:mCG145556, partial [Mus musculus]
GKRLLKTNPGEATEEKGLGFHLGPYRILFHTFMAMPITLFIPRVFTVSSTWWAPKQNVVTSLLCMHRSEGYKALQAFTSGFYF